MGETITSSAKDGTDALVALVQDLEKDILYFADVKLTEFGEGRHSMAVELHGKLRKALDSRYSDALVARNADLKTERDALRVAIVGFTDYAPMQPNDVFVRLARGAREGFEKATARLNEIAAQPDALAGSGDGALREALIERYAKPIKRLNREIEQMPDAAIRQHFREFADELEALASHPPATGATTDNTSVMVACGRCDGAGCEYCDNYGHFDKLKRPATSDGADLEAARQTAVEDTLDRLYTDAFEIRELRFFLKGQGAMHPADRAALRRREDA